MTESEAFDASQPSRRLPTGQPYVLTDAESASGYQRRLRLRIRALARTPLQRERFFAATQGVLPHEAAQVAFEAGVQSDRLSAPVNSDELSLGHMLDGEWFFTARTASLLPRLIADRLGRPARSVLLLGCPTVAVPFLKDGANVTLVDRSEHGLTQYGPAQRPPQLKVINADIRSDLPQDEMREDGESFDAVVLDPPWYPDDYVSWLSLANRLARVGGVVGIPLLQRLTRPTARGERAVLSRLLQQIGPSWIYRGALQYRTPAFEYESLAAAGWPITSPWRTADLVVTQVNGILAPSDFRQARNEMPYESKQPSDGSWHSLDEIAFPKQYVKLRANDRRVSAIEDLQLLPASDEGFQLRSVSQRSGRLVHNPDVWTSRNRVALCNDTTQLARVLTEMASGGSQRLIQSVSNPLWESVNELLYGRD